MSRSTTNSAALRVRECGLGLPTTAIVLTRSVNNTTEMRFDGIGNPVPGCGHPILTYHHGGNGCSITGGYVYRGTAVPAARGRYFYGDYCSGIVWSLRVEGGKAVDNRREGQVANLSSFGQAANGELYLVSLDGDIYRLAP